MRALAGITCAFVAILLVGCGGDGGGSGNGQRSAALAFNLPIYLNTSYNQQTRYPQSTREINGNPGGFFAMADVNNDGRDDLLSVGFQLVGPSDLLLRLGTEDNLFGPARRIDESPRNNTSPLRPAAADFSGDGNVDIAYVTFDNRILVRLGMGDGTFASDAASFSYSGSFTRTPLYAVDVDRDGDIDLVSTTKRVLLNDGTGAFTVVESPTNDEGGVLAPPADFNGDGRPDLFGVFGPQEAPRFGLCLNAGNGLFSGPSFGFKPALAVEPFFSLGLADVADVNLDGNNDVVAMSVDDHYTYLGHGDGTFEEVPTGITPGAGFGGVDFFLRVLDIYGDSSPDLVISRSPLGTHFYIGNGDGTFAPDPVSLTQQFGAFDGFTRDFDRDGQTDLFTGVVFARLPNGQYPADQSLSIVSDLPSSIIALDVNDDSISDLISFGYGTATTFLNDGAGSFSEFAQATLPGASALAVGSPWNALADFNADGRMDVFATHLSPSDPNRFVVALNRGDGTLDLHTTGSVFVANVGLPADLDGDGLPDIVATTVAANSGSTSLAVYFGRGDGGFDQKAVYDEPLDGLKPLIADIDGDGVPSIVVTDRDAKILTFESAPSRTFVPGPMIASGRAIDTGDLDKDGADDVLVLNETTGSLTLYFGGTNNEFAVGQTLPLELSETNTEVTIARLNNSSEQFVLLNSRIPSNGYFFDPWKFTVLRRATGRTFETAYSTVHPGRANDVWAIADFTNDHRLDVVFSLDEQSNTGVVELYPGNGDGTFQDRLTFARAHSVGLPITFGDWDSDGDLDLASLDKSVSDARAIEVKLNYLVP